MKHSSWSLRTCDVEMVAASDEMRCCSGQGFVAAQELHRQWALVVHVLGEWVGVYVIPSSEGSCFVLPPDTQHLSPCASLVSLDC